MNIRFNNETAEKLREYMNSIENRVIRLKVMARGCGKPALGIDLDKQREGDITKVIDNITFVVVPGEEADFKNTEILYSANYVNNGFYVRSFSGR